MGSFSWLKADKLTKIRNVAHGTPFKFLIPKEFGGGYIRDRYRDYGDLSCEKDGSPKYDMYELLAFWNAPEKVKHPDNPVVNGMKTIDSLTEYNRGIGISIGCYDNEVDKLLYPLKLVSASFKGTYEDLDTPSYGDPDQGFYSTPRD